MAYTYEGGCFIHIPKTSGQWVNRVLNQKRDQADRSRFKNDGRPHWLPEKWDYPEIWTIVRRPEEWLASFWAHRRREDKDLKITYARTPYSDLCRLAQPFIRLPFHDFVMSLEGAHGGIVGWFFGLYMVPSVKVVRFENVYQFLKERGFDPDAVPPANVGQDKPEITRGIRSYVSYQEYKFVQAYW